MPEPLPRSRSGRALLRHSAALAFIVAACADDQSAQARQRQQQHTAQSRPTRPARPGALHTGRDAFDDWTTDAPGVRRRITTADPPKPSATESAGNGPRLAPRPADARLKAPAADGPNTVRRVSYRGR